MATKEYYRSPAKRLKTTLNEWGKRVETMRLAKVPEPLIVAQKAALEKYLYEVEHGIYKRIK